MFAPCNYPYYPKLGSQRSSDSIQRLQAAPYLYWLRSPRSSMVRLVTSWRKLNCALRARFPGVATLLHVAHLLISTKLAQPYNGNQYKAAKQRRTTSSRGGTRREAASSSLSEDVSQLHRGIPQASSGEDMPRKAIDELRSFQAQAIGLDVFLIQAQLPSGERVFMGLDQVRVLCNTRTLSRTRDFMIDWNCPVIRALLCLPLGKYF